MESLKSQYQDYFNDIVPILSYIKDYWADYREYLGWKDLDSPLVCRPKILFIGINPGPGRYRQWNYGKAFSEQILPPDYPTPWRSCIGWLSPNVARIKKNGGEAMWWDKQAKRHNLFPYTMCNLLCEVFREQRRTMTYEELTSFLNMTIMVTNISPLVTEDLAALERLYRKLDKCSPWKDARTVFVNHTLRLIDLVRPSMIVYLGKSERESIHHEVKKRGIPIVTISRSFGWHSDRNIKSKADEIREILNSNYL